MATYMIKFILFMVILGACSWFVFVMDNQSGKSDFWGNVVNFVLAIMLTIIVYFVILAVPIILLGIAFVVIVVILALVLEFLRQLFFK